MSHSVVITFLASARSRRLVIISIMMVRPSRAQLTARTTGESYSSSSKFRNMDGSISCGGIILRWKPELVKNRLLNTKEAPSTPATLSEI